MHMLVNKITLALFFVVISLSYSLNATKKWGNGQGRGGQSFDRQNQGRFGFKKKKKKSANNFVLNEHPVENAFFSGQEPVSGSGGFVSVPVPGKIVKIRDQEIQTFNQEVNSQEVQTNEKDDVEMQEFKKSGDSFVVRIGEENTQSNREDQVGDEKEDKRDMGLEIEPNDNSLDKVGFELGSLRGVGSRLPEILKLFPQVGQVAVSEKKDTILALLGKFSQQKKLPDVIGENINVVSLIEPVVSSFLQNKGAKQVDTVDLRLKVDKVLERAAAMLKNAQNKKDKLFLGSFIVFILDERIAAISPKSYGAWLKNGVTFIMLLVAGLLFAYLVVGVFYAPVKTNYDTVIMGIIGFLLPMAISTRTEVFWNTCCFCLPIFNPFVADKQRKELEIYKKAKQVWIQACMDNGLKEEELNLIEVIIKK